MPQIQVIDTTERSPDPTSVEKFFSRLSQQYKDVEDQSQIGNLIDQYKQNREDANAFEDFQFGLEKSNVSPSRRIQMQNNLNEIRKNNTEREKALNTQAKELEAKALKAKEDAAKAQAAKDKADALTRENEIILTSGGKTPEEAKRLAPLVSAQTARSMVKPEKGAKEKFEEGLASEGAKEVPKLEQAIAKGADTLANIDTIENLASKNLKGAKGYIKAALNTEAAAELQTLGATNLDTVIKLFNPAGTLPTAKLNWIRSTFSVSPWDNLSTIKGKLNTQRIITQQSIDRATQRKDLLKKYYGNIPEDVSKEFDKETGLLLDSLEKDLSQEKKEKNVPEGKIRVKDKKTGQTGSVTPYPGMESKYDVLSE